MATVHANQILTIFMLLLGGHYHCVKVSPDSETVRGMGLWEFSGALRELMLTPGGQPTQPHMSKISTYGYICKYCLLFLRLILFNDSYSMKASLNF